MNLTNATILEEARRAVAACGEVRLACRWGKAAALEHLLGEDFLQRGARLRLLLRAAHEADAEVSDAARLATWAGSEEARDAVQVRFARDVEGGVLIAGATVIEGNFVLTEVGGFGEAEAGAVFEVARLHEDEGQAALAAMAFDERFEAALPAEEALAFELPSAPALPAGLLYLGRVVEDEAEEWEPFYLSAGDLDRHALILAGSGAGKSALGIAILEELALLGVPSLVIDTNGDLANLALQFPLLGGADLEEWVDPGEGLRQGLAPEDWASICAGAWRAGREGDGIDGERVARLLERARITVFTPAAVEGVPLAALCDLAPPAEWGDGTWDDVARERAGRLADTLLDLVDWTEQRERARNFLAAILTERWRVGRTPTFAELIGAVREPPFAQLGALDLEEAYPWKKRSALQNALNDFFASPEYSLFARGVPLDLDRLLRDGEGRPRISIFYLAHLPEGRRRPIIANIIAELGEWMRTRTRAGSALSAALFFDEVYGYLPPYPKNPPTKEPLLRLVKQGRKYGVGVILATQNPVDLDSKVFANVKTIFVGRLARDDIEGRGGRLERWLEQDMNVQAEVVPALPDRHFIARDAEGRTRRLRSRHTMCYLRGPLVLGEVPRLAMDRSLLETEEGAAAPPPAAPPPAAPPPAAPPPAAPPPPDRTLGDVRVPAEERPPAPALEGADGGAPDPAIACFTLAAAAGQGAPLAPCVYIAARGAVRRPDGEGEAEVERAFVVPLAGSESVGAACLDAPVESFSGTLLREAPPNALRPWKLGPLAADEFAEYATAALVRAVQDGSFMASFARARCAGKTVFAEEPGPLGEEALAALRMRARTESGGAPAVGDERGERLAEAVAALGGRLAEAKENSPKADIIRFQRGKLARELDRLRRCGGAQASEAGGVAIDQVSVPVDLRRLQVSECALLWRPA